MRVQNQDDDGSAQGEASVLCMLASVYTFMATSLLLTHYSFTFISVDLEADVYRDHHH